MVKQPVNRWGYRRRIDLQRGLYFLFLNIAMIALSGGSIPNSSRTTSPSSHGVVLAFAIGYGFASPKYRSQLPGSFNKGKINVGDTIGTEGVRQRSSDDNSRSYLEVESREVLIP